MNVQSKFIPTDIRTRVHNQEVKLKVLEAVLAESTKKNSMLEERIMKLEKIIILNKLE